MFPLPRRLRALRPLPLVLAALLGLAQPGGAQGVDGDSTPPAIAFHGGSRTFSGTPAPSPTVDVRVCAKNLPLASTAVVTYRGTNVTSAFTDVTPSSGTGCVSSHPLWLRGSVGPLPSGPSTLTARVCDAQGLCGEASAVYTWQADPAPAITLSPTVLEQYAARMPLEVTWRDNLRLDPASARVVLNGSAAAGVSYTGSDTLATSRVELALAPGDNTVVVSIRDALGQPSQLTRVYRLSAAPPGTRTIAVSPAADRTGDASRAVEVVWSGWLNGDTRRITLNGVDVADQFTHADSGSTCTATRLDECLNVFSRSRSRATLALAPGENVLAASICDADDAHACGTVTTRWFRWTAAQAAPVVDATPHRGDFKGRDPFEAALSYTTPAYVSMDQPRAAAFVWSNELASPTGFVQLDVADHSQAPPAAVSLRLLQADGARVSLTSGDTAVYFAAGEGVTRVAAHFFAGHLATGAYSYTAVVRTHWGDGTTREATVPLRVLVHNLAGSPFGAGWWPAGYERLHPQGDDLLLAYGDGSLGWFRRTGCAAAGAETECAYASPAGDASTLTRVASAAGTEYRRRTRDGTVRVYRADGALVGAVDRLGNAAGIALLDAARPSAYTDPSGRRIRLSYDGAGRLAAVTDSLRTTVFTIDASNHLVAVTEPDGVVALAPAYNAHHLVTGWTDRNGGAWTLAYDERRTLAQVQGPAVATPSGTARPATRYRSGRAAVYPRSSVHTSLAAPAPRVVPAEAWATVVPPGGDSTQVVLDRWGLPWMSRDTVGRVAYAWRDAQGRDSLLLTAEGDTLASTWRDGRLWRAWDSGRGVATFYEYAPAYDLVTSVLVWAGAPDLSTGRAVSTQRWWYGAGALPDSARAGDGVRQFWTWDARGRLRSTRTAAGDTTRYEYDTTGPQNLRQVRGPTGTESYEYDAHGRAVAAVDALGRRSTMEYDAVNRPVGSRDPLNLATTTHWGRMFADSVSDPRQQRYGFRPNALGWDTVSLDLAGQATRRVFRADGQPASVTDRRGRTTTFAYDGRGRLVSVQPAGMAATVLAYDPAGRWAAVRNAASTDTVFYDDQGRVVREVAVRGGRRYEVASSWAAQGRTGVAVAESGSAVPLARTGYLLADDGRLQGVMADERATWLRRDGEGRVTAVEYPNGMAETVGYGAADRRVSLGWNLEALDEAAGALYTRDALGRVTERRGGGTVLAGADTVEVYRYDAGGRLSRYGRSLFLDPSQCGWTREGGLQCPGGSASADTAWTWYAYDNSGNRTDSNAQFTAANRVTIFGGLTLAYWNDGSLRRRYREGNLAQLDQRFVWNALGQLDSVYTGGQWVRYEYDGLGRRVRKQVGAAVTEYVYDGDAVMAEVDGATGAVLATYAHFPGVDQPHSMRRGGERLYYLRDHQGSVAALADSTGALANRYSYDPWGNARVSVERVPNRYRYTGRELDAETGLYHYRARYYDPVLGRFISEDPAGLVDGTNLYAYTGNDPVNRLDAFGLSHTDAEGPGEICWTRAASTRVVLGPLRYMDEDGRYIYTEPGESGRRDYFWMVTCIPSSALTNPGADLNPAQWSLVRDILRGRIIEAERRMMADRARARWAVVGRTFVNCIPELTGLTGVSKLVAGAPGAVVVYETQRMLQPAMPLRSPVIDIMQRQVSVRYITPLSTTLKVGAAVGGGTIAVGGTVGVCGAKAVNTISTLF